MHQISKNKINLIYRSSVFVSHHKHIITLGTLHCLCLCLSKSETTLGHYIVMKIVYYLAS